MRPPPRQLHTLPTPPHGRAARSGSADRPGSPRGDRAASPSSRLLYSTHGVERATAATQRRVRTAAPTLASTHPSPPRWRWRASARLAAERQCGAPTERHGARLAPPADASRRQHHRAHAADAQERAECGHRLASCTRCRRRLTGERLAAARRTGPARHAATGRPRPRRGSSTRRTASSAPLRPRSGASGPPPRPSPARIHRHPDGDGVPRLG